MSREAQERFSRIHRHYDFFNHLFSLGTDIRWRNAAAREAMLGKKRYKVLDVATGTGDLAIATALRAKSLGKRIIITGIDFNNSMLSHVMPKIRRLGLGNIRAEKGDALHMKFRDSSFDVVTSAFALRNFDNLETFSRELRRVLKNGGKFVLLDMAMPSRGAGLVKQYFKMMRLIGSVVNRKAYRFLTESITQFDRRRMVDILKKSGFRDVKIKNLSGEMAFIISGRK